MLRQLPRQDRGPPTCWWIFHRPGLAAGLQEKLFQPSAEQNKGFYAELPIKIRLVGSYHQFGTFVSGIAALPRIVTLHDIQITPAGDAKNRRLRQPDHGCHREDLPLYRRRRRRQGTGEEEIRRRDVRQRRGGPRLIGIAVLASLVAAGLFRRAIRSAEMDCRHQEKSRGGRIQPLPEVKPYETFVYGAGRHGARRFKPLGPSAGRRRGACGPSSRRNREFLEGFSLDTLKMVGTFKVGRQLLRAGPVEGRLGAQSSAGAIISDKTTAKSPRFPAAKLVSSKIIPDGLGGYIERPASLALTD